MDWRIYRLSSSFLEELEDGYDELWVPPSSTLRLFELTVLWATFHSNSLKEINQFIVSYLFFLFCTVLTFFLHSLFHKKQLFRSHSVVHMAEYKMFVFLCLFATTPTSTTPQSHPHQRAHPTIIDMASKFF